MRTFNRLLFCAASIAALHSCDRLDDFVGEGGGGEGEEQGTMFENKSSLEPLVALEPQFNFVDAYSLISSTDILDNGFQLVGAKMEPDF